jgi:hypothetical protein
MKLGRNDLCPCNSGKKFKKCCMFKEYLEYQKEKEEFERWFEEDCKLGQQRMKEANER